MKATLIGAAMLTFSTGAMAAAPQEEPAREAPQPERKVCHTTKVTGSLTRRARICLTEAQWQEVHNRTKRGLDEFNRGASGGCRAPSNPAAGTMCGG